MISDKAAVIQRYEQSRIGMRKDDEGAWVSYTDHAAALEAMTSDRDSWQEQASDRVKDWDEMRRKAEAARDEVDRLRYEAGLKEETISKSAERTAFALSRAEAAERRVAGLERAASNVIRKAQQKSKLTTSVFTGDLQRLEAALAPAKKVD